MVTGILVLGEQGGQAGHAICELIRVGKGQGDVPQPQQVSSSLAMRFITGWTKAVSLVSMIRVSKLSELDLRLGRLE
jgi:hypothetical protein